MNANTVCAIVLIHAKATIVWAVIAFPSQCEYQHSEKDK